MLSKSGAGIKSHHIIKSGARFYSEVPDCIRECKLLVSPSLKCISCFIHFFENQRSAEDMFYMFYIEPMN